MRWLRRRSAGKPGAVGPEQGHQVDSAVESQGIAGTAASRELRDFLGDLVASGGVSAAAALVGTPGGVVGTSTVVGSEEPASGAVPLFDLASLTKPFMATLALRLHLEDLLPLDLPVGEIWPEATPELARRTLSELLRHRAGFQPWTPLYSRCASRGRVAPLLVGGSLLGAAQGTYSDLGYILWGLAAERWLSSSLAEQTALRLTAFGAPGELRSAPGARPGVLHCRLGNGREVELAAEQGFEVGIRPGPGRGEVQDGNARFLGGLAGHAGLFGGVRALWRLAREWLRPGAMLEKGAVAEALGGSGPYALGWARKTEGESPSLSRDSFGHTGFTGGALWVDPRSTGIYVLLAHRRAVSVDMGPWRHRFFRLAAGLD